MTTIQSHQIVAARKKGIVLGLVMILIVIATVFTIQSLEVVSFDDIIQQTNMWLLLASLIPMTFTWWFMALRWQSLLQTKPPSSELSALICAGLLLNYAAPGPVGEFGTAWFAKQRYKIAFTDALAAVVIARLVGLLSASALGGVVWALNTLPIQEEHLVFINGLSIVTLLMGFGLLVVTLFPNLCMQMVEKTIPVKLHQIQLVQKFHLALNRLTKSITMVTQLGGKAFVQTVLWSVCAHLCVIASIIVIALAIGAPFSMGGIFFTYAITTAGSVLLFLLPGSYVGWDALFFGLLVGSAAIPTKYAILIVAVVRIQQLFFMIVGGISLHWLLQGVTKSVN